MTDLARQINFLLEIDKSKQVFRQTYLADGSRKENDAEHSWHLAIMAFLLADYANTPIDVLKTVKMLLIHDLIEIDAGDTYAYDAEGNASKAARENAAADRIFSILPESQAHSFRALWDEFEAGTSSEACFARALDRIQPLLLNDASGGKSWKEHNVRTSQVLARNAQTGTGSSRLWEYCCNLIEKNTALGHLEDDRAPENSL